MSGDIDPDVAMLQRLAELDLAAVETAHARFMAAEPGQDSDNAGRTYQRMSRSLRQTLALKARLTRKDRAPATPAGSRPPEVVAKAEAIRETFTRLVYTEREDEALEALEELDFYLRIESEEAGFLDEPQVRILARLWNDIDLGDLPAELKPAPPPGLHVADPPWRSSA